VNAASFTRMERGVASALEGNRREAWLVLNGLKMTAVLVALLVFLVLIVLLLFGAYVEIGRELPCKRISPKHGSVSQPAPTASSHDAGSSHTRKAA
jgi:hypothetical protein